MDTLSGLDLLFKTGLNVGVPIIGVVSVFVIVTGSYLCLSSRKNGEMKSHIVISLWISIIWLSFSIFGFLWRHLVAGGVPSVMVSICSTSSVIITLLFLLLINVKSIRRKRRDH